MGTEFLILLGLVFSFHILYRNDKTHKLLIYINELCFNHDMRHIDDLVSQTRQSAYTRIKMPEYTKVLFSMRPIKIENWLSQDDIDFLNQ